MRSVDALLDKARERGVPIGTYAERRRAGPLPWRECVRAMRCSGSAMPARAESEDRKVVLARSIAGREVQVLHLVAQEDGGATTIDRHERAMHEHPPHEVKGHRRDV